MSVTLSKIHWTRKTEKTVYVTSALAKQLRLRGRRTVDVRLGGKSVTAQWKPLRRSGKHMYLPLIIKDAIRAPKIGSLYLASNDNGNSVRLGPLIGILTSGGFGGNRPFGTRTGLIRAYLQAGNKKAYYFAFTPRDINWDNETVFGYFINPEGGWTRRTVPLPDVVYNRLASRSADVSSSMESLKSKFLRRNIPVFNWSFFNKWDVYRLLEDDDAYKHVPESVINPTPEKLQEMLERHRFIYLKPTHGSLGKGIYRITYAPSKGYFARFRRNGGNVLLRYQKYSALVKMLGLRRGRLRNYVAQQGVRLVEIDDSPIDFRFHLVRNGLNDWIVAGIGAKKAGKGSVTTHIKNGGTLMTPEQALSRVFGGRSGEVLARMKGVSIKLAEAIQRNYRHHIGELGFDLGIDTDEHVWMFEANSKPGRSIFKHPSLKEEGRDTLHLLFQHCLYLAKFRKRGNS
ncbi:YheC/YheD family endospore coat-associated protein [Paenibacillus alkalitolerans]|uniref:YheC/YheD family endospore coat-associated protein n=1 Tax=Paenibacillus alkalitolerans TaxID=2799335 RepID=UPI0018F2DCB7|nr:YheC/YheD family protein [Paenibacillus alkalitolerans]